MNIDTTSAKPMSGPRKGHAGRNVLAGAIAAGALLTASVGLWAYNNEESATIAEVPSIQAALPALPTAVSATVGQSTPYTIYIVSSEERAAEVSATLEDGNVVLASQGELPMRYEVIVATTEEADAVLASEADLDAIRATAGEPSVAFVDLRD